MSRRTRKVKAWKEYKLQQTKKTLAIAEVSINTALAIAKCIADNNSLGSLMAFEMGREQTKCILWQPIFKPNKYGYFPKPMGITVSIKCDASKFDESIKETMEAVNRRTR